MKISVVIPMYNAEDTILPCIESVLNQTFPVEEIVVVDDGSIDKSYTKLGDFVKTNQLEDKILLLQQINAGPSKARNVGIERSTGDWIAFIDSDDYWERDKLEIQSRYLEKDSDISFCGTAFEDTKINRSIFYKIISFNNLLLKNYFSTPTVMIKKEVFEAGFMFDEHQRASEDYRLWLLIAYSYKCLYINSILARNQFSKLGYGVSGLSSNLWKMEKGELSNYKFLYLNDKINLLSYFFLSVFSISKYLRRMLIVKFSSNN